jgi:uncharacterized protein (DUF736 family)
MAYDDTNTGILSRNNDRKTDKHPEFKGSQKVLCPHCNQSSDHWSAAWVRERKEDGNKFFSIKLTPKEEKKAYAKPVAAAKQDDFSDDIPF